MFEQVRAPLRFRPFTVVLTGEGLSMVGDGAFGVALAWLVLQETGSVAALAIVLLAQAIPQSLLMLFGGATTDRLSPRTVMFCSHLVRGVAVAAVGALAWAGSVHMWQLYVLAVVTGVAGAFFGPASESVLPFLLPAQHLPRGNALQGAVEQAAIIGGPLVGGLLTAWLGSAAAIELNALTFFIAATTVLAAPRGEAAHQDRMSVSGVLKEIGEGLNLARQSHEVRIVLLIVSASALSYSGVFAVGLPALARSFSSNAVALGTLISAWGVGQLLGVISAAFTGLPRRWGLLIIGMTVVEATAFALLGVSPNVLTAAAILVVVGFGVAYSQRRGTADVHPDPHSPTVPGTYQQPHRPAACCARPGLHRSARRCAHPLRQVGIRGRRRSDAAGRFSALPRSRSSQPEHRPAVTACSEVPSRETGQALKRLGEQFDG